MTATVPQVRDGSFAEVRVAFPRAWVAGLAPVGEAGSTDRMQAILDEETAWAADAQARREQQRALTEGGGIAQVALPAVLLVAVLVYRATRGRSPKPAFTDQFLTEIPRVIIPPCSRPLWTTATWAPAPLPSR